MISIFRRHLQGRALRYTIYAISFLVAFPMVLSLFTKWFDDGNWAIKVNGKAVGALQYQQRFTETKQQIDQLKQRFGPMAEQFLAMQGLSGDIQELTVHSLVMQELFNQAAQSLGLAVSPAYVDRQLLASLPKNFFTPSGEINESLLTQVVHMPLVQFKERMAEQLKQQLLLSLGQGALYIPEFQLKQAYVATYADRSFTIATFARAPFIAASKKEAVTDTQLKSFYDEQNRLTKRYWEPERRSGVIWEFDPEHYGIAINDSSITSYYNRHKYDEFVETPLQIQVRHILLPATLQEKAAVKAKAAALAQELQKNPKLFAQKATELSADTATKKNGGLTGFFSRGTYDPAFEKAAFELGADGAITLPVEVKDGFEVIQRVAKKVQTYKPLEKVRGNIVSSLRKERFGQFFAFEVKRALAQENAQEMLEQMAQRKGGKKRVLLMVERGNQPNEYMQKLFSVGKGLGGAVVDGDRGYAVLVTDIVKMNRPELSAIKDRVVHDWHVNRAHLNMQKIVAQALKKTNKADFDDFAKAQGAQLTTTGMINAHDDKKSEGLRKQLGEAFASMATLATPGAVTSHESADRVIVIHLDAVAPFNEQQFNAKRGELLGQLFGRQKMLLEKAFIASLYKPATIKINDKLMKWAR